MTVDRDAEISKLNEGQLASRMREVFDGELVKMESAVDAEVYRVINGGESLDPQFAVQCWLRKHAVSRLRNLLKQKEEKGKSAARRLDGHM